MENLQSKVDELISKAAAAHDSADALRYSQAALNVAHTKHALADIVHLKD